MAKKDDPDSDLPTFRVADVRRPVVRTGKPNEKPGAAGAEPPPSAGFPNVEAVLESSSIEEVAEQLRKSYEQLEEIALGKNAKLKGSAKKAMAAYERAADLFEYLFSTKASIGK
ncbi:MAG: hypothetical protein IT384_27130 [Deltaproteobacteria bacterium]|nr:hypothetical protein [Deltaproteobacteria bacterium]